jgi:hypothetical protein
MAKTKEMLRNEQRIRTDHAAIDLLMDAEDYILIARTRKYGLILHHYTGDTESEDLVDYLTNKMAQE